MYLIVKLYARWDKKKLYPRTTIINYSGKVGIE